jgi:hypothetical protein
MSLTKKEEQELEILMTRLENADFEDAEAEDNNEVESDFRKWVSQKKKEWQEETKKDIREWALRQPEEGGTSFYDYHKALLRYLD